MDLCGYPGLHPHLEDRCEGSVLDGVASRVRGVRWRPVSRRLSDGNPKERGASAYIRQVLLFFRAADYGAHDITEVNIVEHVRLHIFAKVFTTLNLWPPFLHLRFALSIGACQCFTMRKNLRNDKPFANINPYVYEYGTRAPAGRSILSQISCVGNIRQC